MNQFSDMGFSKQLEDLIQAVGLSSPTPIQALTLPQIALGVDLIGIAQTGSGKTLAYGLGVLKKLEQFPNERALILLPNRETADQVFRVLKGFADALKISIVLAATGVPNSELTSQLKKNPRILVATTGRLVEQLRNNKLLLQGLKILVLDEGDRMLDRAFEEQLKFILSTLRGDRQTLLFGASFGPVAEKIAKLILKPDALRVQTESAQTPVESLHQKVFYISVAQKENRLLDELRKLKGGVIVFADSQESCVRLGRLLAHHEFSSDFMHGEMNPGHRGRVVREFRNKEIQILITTDLLARGLDVPHVEHVVSFDLPYKAEDFLHRIGRTARAGREGSALTFVTPGDGRTFRKMKNYLVGAEEVFVMQAFKFAERE